MGLIASLPFWRRPKLRRPARSDGAAAILCPNPMVVYACLDGSMSVATYFGEQFPGRPATFFLFPSWTIESKKAVAKVHRHAERHRHRFPRHQLIFLCNTPGEAALLARQGERAVCSNQNIMLSEDIYRPLPEATVVFDAVYNARPEPWKRHELAFSIPRVAYVTYWYPVFSPPEIARARVALLSQQSGHAIMNPIKDGLPTILPAEAVNEVYSRSAVGLCLSAAEGAMYAAVEYLLAGLPVVSTPSLGGRNVFFDPDFCRIVPPDPAKVHDAVAELQARRIPRDHIRSRTLARIDPERQRFLSLVNETLARSGGSPLFDQVWPFRDRSKLISWKNLADHFRSV